MDFEDAFIFALREGFDFCVCDYKLTNTEAQDFIKKLKKKGKTGKNKKRKKIKRENNEHFSLKNKKATFSGAITYRTPGIFILLFIIQSSIFAHSLQICN